MPLLDVIISTLLCFLDGFGISCADIELLKTSNTVINCIIIELYCGLPNGTKLSNFMNIVNDLS